MAEADDLKSREERKRERMWNPRRRWQAVQQAITWAEQQPAVRRNTRACAMALQRRHRAADRH